MEPQRSRPAATLLSTILSALLAFPEPALCQSYGMSFSVYNGAYPSSDFSTLYMTSTVSDQSWGCSHGNYSTTAMVHSPTGRVASTQSSGLRANTAIPTLGEVGSYALTTTGTYFCSCFGRNAGYGGGTNFPLYFFPSGYLDEMAGGLLGYSSFDYTTGRILSADLSPDAYNYLVGAGYMAGVAVAGELTWEIPIVGEVVIIITVVYVGYEGAKALHGWVMTRGSNDPALIGKLGTSRPGTRDADGKCNPTPPNQTISGGPRTSMHSADRFTGTGYAGIRIPRRVPGT